MLKVSGQYVSPVEVESALGAHPAVLECAVIGRQDGDGLTETAAYVVLRCDHQPNDTLADELKAFVKGRLAPHKYHAGWSSCPTCRRRRPARSSATACAMRPDSPMPSFASLEAGGAALRLEYEWVGLPDSPHPTVVFLQEGLGWVALWKDFPERLCRAAGLRGLVYSRQGYGRSTPRPHDER